ncbi:unnamed protein product, partial [Medioppia subpectinata]
MLMAFTLPIHSFTKGGFGRHPFSKCDRTMSLLITRFVSAVVLFALTLVVGTVPVLWYRSWLRRKRHHRIRDNEMTAETSLSDNFYVQIVTQMGGGILFFT